jgi:hypothetical protein
MKLEVECGYGFMEVVESFDEGFNSSFCLHLKRLCGYHLPPPSTFDIYISKTF